MTKDEFKAALNQVVEHARGRLLLHDMVEAIEELRDEIRGEIMRGAFPAWGEPPEKPEETEGEAQA
jgi:hypothetical protein